MTRVDDSLETGEWEIWGTVDVSAPSSRPSHYPEQLGGVEGADTGTIGGYTAVQCVGRWRNLRLDGTAS